MNNAADEQYARVLDLIAEISLILHDQAAQREQLRDDVTRLTKELAHARACNRALMQDAEHVKRTGG